MQASIHSVEQHGQRFSKALVENFSHALTEAGVALSPDLDYDVPYEALEGVQRLDAIVHLKDDPGTVVAIECKLSAFPRDVRDALWQLDEYARSLEKQSGAKVIKALLAERLSPGARDALRHRGVAFYDASGTLFFRHGPVTIDIHREPEPEKRSKAGSPFVGAREQVVHALLAFGGDGFTGQELAQKAQTSPYTVSQTLQVLQQHGWIEGEAAGRNAHRRLVAPGALLDAWAESWRSRKETRSTWFFFANNQKLLPNQVASRLLNAGRNDWAYTGAAAGNALSPFLTSVDRLQMIVPPGATSDVAAAAKLSRAEQGSNVTVVERRGASEHASPI